ncbi:U6 snRNA phosphodiesterase [Cephus cinctus]|uniref:U6 snRNA phosphodiesterase n=1 Tax=Cephus cinctus TaxID=211228 RepID=A0AAJ7RI75_CEPCN|nr:U6 snRNA phosphodiesterase [Cephus cinctus]
MMSGLSLIATYSSDSDGEVENNDIPNFETKKAEGSLPLPLSIVEWKGVSHHEEVIDDPSLHDGRIRSFKHERGNWATLVYINYAPSDSMKVWMESIKSLISIEDSVIFDHFHISLTRTVTLKFHWIDSFIDAVKNICQNISQFSVEFTDVKAYCNDDRTRTFLGICCRSDNGTLDHLTKAFNKLLAEYQLPPFYEEASYHASFLWCLGDKEERLNSLLPSLTNSLNNFWATNSDENCVHVDSIHCKIGNRMYNITLK